MRSWRRGAALTGPDRVRTGGADVPDCTARSIRGRHLLCRDGEIGHADDTILDDESWTLPYLLIDMSNWIGGTHVLLPTAAVRDGRPVNAELDVDLPVERVRTAPEYDAAKPLDSVFEQKVRAHFGLGFEPKPAPRRSARQPVGL
jgi:hypothetical protein